MSFETNWLSTVLTEGNNNILYYYMYFKGPKSVSKLDQYSRTKPFLCTVDTVLSSMHLLYSLSLSLALFKNYFCWKGKVTEKERLQEKEGQIFCPLFHSENDLSVLSWEDLKSGPRNFWVTHTGKRGQELKPPVLLSQDTDKERDWKWNSLARHELNPR